VSEIVIVTGASRGIGAATARLLGSRGYAVCVNYRSGEAAAQRVVADIERDGGRAIAVQADVADPGEVAHLFARVDEGLGTLTALVNNAGVHGPRCRFEALAREDLEQVLATNVLGLMHCTQEAVRRMSRRFGGSGGAVVNVSSGSAYIGNAGHGVHYAVSKGAVNSFTIGLSQELAADGVRVNAVSPGLTRTDMPPREVLDAPGPLIPAGRVAEPEEIAEAIAWLLSPRAGYVMGANIRVAGGRP
jgi:NAD(P)-dependent dehydrogenase (short-subunit alcohol dehydrogenase family)